MKFKKKKTFVWKVKIYNNAYYSKLYCSNMKVNVVKGNWYCPSCHCVLCGECEFNGDSNCFTKMIILLGFTGEQYDTMCVHIGGYILNKKWHVYWTHNKD